MWLVFGVVDCHLARGYEVRGVDHVFGDERVVGAAQDQDWFGVGGWW